MSTSVTEIDADNSVKVRKTKRKSAGRRPAEKDPLALPKRKPKAVPTKAARKQPAQPEEYEVSGYRPFSLITRGMHHFASGKKQMLMTFVSSLRAGREDCGSP